MGVKTFNTNLASEFYVLSALHRIGASALLTLGNKKAVDIVVEKDDKVITIDVKGLMGTTNFPIDNCKTSGDSHYIVFVSFLNKINDINTVPEVFIVPSTELNMKHKELSGKSIVYHNPGGNRTVVQYGRLKKVSSKYKDKWNVFIS
ncbi:hypothetical protein AGMMS50267_16210 [Spirochaetia bacterium]|nr:hypothetical protein AGMMS50267_16210 [Spirochaetia bacterium]